MYALPVRTAFPSPASRKIFRKPFVFGYNSKSEYPKRIGKGSHHYSKTAFDATLLCAMALIRYF